MSRPRSTAIIRSIDRRSTGGTIVFALQQPDDRVDRPSRTVGPDGARRCAADLARRFSVAPKRFGPTRTILARHAFRRGPNALDDAWSHRPGSRMGRFGARVALAAAGRISDSAFGWDSFRWHRKHAWIARHGMDIASWQEADQPRHTRGSATAPNPHGAKRDRRHWPGGRASTSLAAQANEERYP